MKLAKWQYGIIIAAFTVAVAIAYQSFTYKPRENQLSNTEALNFLKETELSGRELTDSEIQSGEFHNLKVRIAGMACLSCSDTVFYGLINMKGIANARIQEGTSCVIYDNRTISRKDIIDSELFQSGVYMAEPVEDTQVHSREDAKCL